MSTQAWRRPDGGGRVTPSNEGEPCPRRRLLIVGESGARLAALTDAVRRLGHDVVLRDYDPVDAGAVVAGERPDAALVGRASGRQQALALIEATAAEGCPTVALVEDAEPAYLREAACRGAFAYVLEPTPRFLQSSIEIAICRGEDYRRLRDAFGRRAAIEQAKGILMERYGLTAEKAFALLRRRSQATGTKLADIAAGLTESHLLLPASDIPPRA